MKRLWYRILALLAPGTRVVLALLVLGCLATVFGVLTRLYHLYVWLALSAPTFWTGQIWQVVTYALLPVDVLSFLINGLAIAALGGALERVWSPRELWFYVALVTVAAGGDEDRFPMFRSIHFGRAGPVGLRAARGLGLYFL